MTDKQIIDGVDVSGCKNLMQGIVPFGCMEDRKTCSCMNNPNCLYKQLKRKEQECEELNKTITNLENIRDEFSTKLDQLKGENVGALKQLEFVRTLNTVQEADIRKLKQTLAEIKPILEFYANSNMGEEQPDKTYHIMLNGSYIMVYDPKPARQALQKINEVENEKKENCN